MTLREVQKSLDHYHCQRHHTPSPDQKDGNDSKTLIVICRPCRRVMYEDDALVRERKRNPMFTSILERGIPRPLEKPRKIQSYDGIRDLDEHLEYVDNQLDYYHTDIVSKCKLFSLTLIGLTMAWYKILLDESIDSLRDLCKAFTAHFTACKCQPTTIVILNGITQGKKETLLWLYAKTKDESVGFLKED